MWNLNPRLLEHLEGLGFWVGSLEIRAVVSLGFQTLFPPLQHKACLEEFGLKFLFFWSILMSLKIK